MFFKLNPKLALAALFVIAALPGFSQVVPAAYQGGLPFAVGGGMSDWNVDWGQGNKFGGATLWMDYFPPFRPKVLHGIGVEIEAHDVHFNLNPPPNLRQVTVGGGALYTWRHFQNFSPYAKFEMGWGREDFPNRNPLGSKPYQHDVVIYMAPGAGLEYRVYRHIWVRADYEYQRWGPIPPAITSLTPNGFTFGAMFDFRHHRGL
jgi:opacity protein-like surface antigen